MENIVNAGHRVLARLQVTHVADVELDLMGNFRITHLIFVAHIILLLLITAEYADFLDVGVEETFQHSVTERAGTSRDQEGLVFEY